MEPESQEEELNCQGRSLVTTERKTENMKPNADASVDLVVR